MPYQSVRELLLHFAETYIPHYDQANERHAHHLLTGDLQQKGLVIGVDLFLEWPTFRKDRLMNYGVTGVLPRSNSILLARMAAKVGSGPQKLDSQQGGQNESRRSERGR